MCYMKHSEQVGVRELRQNLSVHLARVIKGETLEVTDRGVAVAVLAPLVHGESSLARLKREGRLIPATTELLSGRRARAKAPRALLRAPRALMRALQRERDDRAL